MIATVLVNGAAIATILLQPPPAVSPSASGGDSQGRQPPKQYFLNITTQDYRTSLKCDGQDSLWIYAAVSCTDPTVDCTPLTGAIHFHAAGDCAAWLVPGSPTLSAGYMAIQVTAQPPQPGAPLPSPGASVIASTMIEGQVVSGEVALQLSSELQLQAWVDGRKEYTVTFHPKDKSWYLKPVVVYFANPGEETPVKPPFQYGFPDPAFTANPDGLFDLEECFTDDNGLSYTFKLKLRAGVQPSDVLGDDFENNDGKCVVSITAIDENQKNYTGSVTFSFRPELVPMFWMFEQDSRVAIEERQYRDGTYKKFHILCDGRDEVNLALIFVRSDWIEEGKEGPDYLSQAADFVRIGKIDLIGEGSSQFETEPDTQAGTPYELKVKSKNLVLATPTADNYKPSVHIDALLEGPQAARFASQGIKVRIDLKPCPVFLKLIVVPSRSPGKSLAVAYTGTCPPKQEPQPLSGSTVRVDVIHYGSPWLAVEGNSDATTDQYGIASWELSYHGMTWKNKQEARFKVRAGIVGLTGAPPIEATYQEIDVNSNGARWLNALVAAAPSLRLTNPIFKSRSLGILFPDYLCGPINNAHDLISPLTHATHFQPYTCGQLRDRIWDWTFERRRSYDLEICTSMNGLDFFKYQIKPLHVFFGFNLAGTEDPYFIDPWWEQEFNPDHVIQTYTTEVAKATGTLAAGALVIAPVVYAMAVSLGYTVSYAAVQASVLKLLRGVGVLTGAGNVATGGGLGIGKDDGLGYLSGGVYQDVPQRWGVDFFMPAERLGRSYKVPAGLEKLRSGHVSPLESW